MSSDTLTFGDWDVTFTDGASIYDIKPHRTYTDILLKNLSSSFNNADLQSEISRFGSASVMRDSRRKRARVRFLDPSVAAKALVDLDSKRLGLSRVEATLDRSKDMQWIEDGILLVYDTCETTAQVSFLNEADTTEALRLNRSIFQGRKIRITKENDFTLFVEDLPATFEEDDLMTFFMADEISITRDFGEEAEIDSLLQSLIREQPGCASLYLVPLPSQTGQGAGWIRMFNSERAARVCSEIRGLRPIFLGGNTVQATKAQSIVWRLTPRQHVAIKALLRELTLEDVFFLYDPDISQDVEMRIVSADSRRLRDAKVLIDAIVKGEVWKEGEAPLWDKHWVTEEGAKFIHEVHDLSSAYVAANLSDRTLSISGQEEARDCAKVLLQNHLDELDAQKHWIRLPKDVMEYFVEHGMPRLSSILSHFDSSIGRTRELDFKGSDIAHQKINTIIDQCTCELEIQASTLPRPICPVCTTEVTDPLKLECGHNYCSECLEHLLTSAIDFPIRCIAEHCEHAPSLRVIRRIVHPAQYRRLLEVAFRTHLRGSRTLHACPTVDCPQFWSSQSSVTQCSTCLILICAECKVEQHVGMTCEEYQRTKVLHQSERQLATWRRERGADVKACPSCGSIVEKVDGCPHIHCANCGAHWCWECSKVMRRAEIVYAHIRRRHGWAAHRFLAPLYLA
jgi:hypothetical protein